MPRQPDTEKKMKRKKEIGRERERERKREREKEREREKKGVYLSVRPYNRWLARRPLFLRVLAYISYLLLRKFILDKFF